MDDQCATCHVGYALSGTSCQALDPVYQHNGDTHACCINNTGGFHQKCHGKQSISVCKAHCTSLGPICRGYVSVGKDCQIAVTQSACPTGFVFDATGLSATLAHHNSLYYAKGTCGSHNDQNYGGCFIKKYEFVQVNLPFTNGVCGDPDPAAPGTGDYVCPIGYIAKSSAARTAKCTDGVECQKNCCDKSTTNSAANYIKLPNVCVNGNKISTHAGSTPLKCAQICDSNSKCLAFNFAYEGGGTYAAGTVYTASDCVTLSSSDTSGCDGVLSKLDLYIKDTVKALIQVPPQQTDNASFPVGIVAIVIIALQTMRLTS
jgi:hypothetical protein